MFSNWFLKSFRILLLPFAIIYWLIIWLRNFFYDKNIFNSSSFGLPVICVGNLSIGGTGKSPMVEFLVGCLKDKFKVATLSRGYKRKTSGYALANENSTALDIGDEPMLFHLKFPTVPVAVGEERLVAIPQLLHASKPPKFTFESHFCIQIAFNLSGEAFQSARSLPLVSNVVTLSDPYFEVVPVSRNDSFTPCS